MKHICIWALLVVLAFASAEGIGDLLLEDTGRHEPVDYTYNKRFSFSNAMRRLKQIQGALSSFQKLTEISSGKLDKKELANIGNTGWEDQNLGFYNWVRSVEGTVMKQNYVIQKLELELSKLCFKEGQLTEKELEKKQETFEQTEKKFQEFWDSFKVMD
ncbi:hypothetical protein ACFL1R_03900 [Candidatus Latescibacterota bacterium]